MKRAAAFNKSARVSVQSRSPLLRLGLDLRAGCACGFAAAAAVISVWRFVLRLGRRSRARSRVTAEPRRRRSGAMSAVGGFLGVAVGALRALAGLALGWWLLVGGVARLCRLCRPTRAARRPGEARGPPRPTCYRGGVSAVRGGFSSRSIKQLDCEEAPPGCGWWSFVSGFAAGSGDGDFGRTVLACGTGISRGLFVFSYFLGSFVQSALISWRFRSVPAVCTCCTLFVLNI